MNEPLQNPRFPQRARPAHAAPIEQRNRSIIIDLTVCTKNRARVLANPNLHEIIRNSWIKATHWLVGRYMVMPDHIHFFCAPGGLEIRPLDNWVKYWKGDVSRSVGAPEGRLWQRDFWDTQLRNRDSYAAKWEYVRNNPVRAGLVARTEDWPYQGELNVLRWHA